MVIVPGGEFLMGSTPEDCGPAAKSSILFPRFDGERPRRKVTITRAFAVSKFAVTFDQWDACVAAWRMHSRRRRRLGTRQAPRNQCQFERCPAICGVVRQADRSALSPAFRGGMGVLRLGQERRALIPGVRKSARETQIAGIAVANGIASGRRLSAHSKPMHSASMTCTATYGSGSRTSGTKTIKERHYDGSVRLGGNASLGSLRGGSWNDNPCLYLRSANRERNSATIRFFNVGFRLARTLLSRP